MPTISMFYGILIRMYLGKKQKEIYPMIKKNWSVHG
jgi:hypothetical protein